MSLEYCEDCDKMIDLDYDSEHEHFDDDDTNDGGKTK